MSLNVNASGFNQTRLPMNLSERSMLGASKAASSPAFAPQLAAPTTTTKPTQRFRTLTSPSPTPVQTKAAPTAPTRNPYQASAQRASYDDFAIVADSTPGDASVLSVASPTSALNAPNPLADRIKDIQHMATQLGYVELSEGAITKAIQNRSSLLANYVV